MTDTELLVSIKQPLNFNVPFSMSDYFRMLHQQPDLMARSHISIIIP